MRILIALGLFLVVLAVAASLRRRTSAAPTRAGPEHSAPSHVHRADFPEVEQRFMLVVFTSETCNACAQAVDVAAGFTGPTIGLVECEYTADRARHERYGIDAVPTTLVVDETGEVRNTWFGPTAATDVGTALRSLGAAQQPPAAQ